jgi:hypothetical protein
MGIVHEVSAAYSQWQNGIVERAIGVAWEGAEAMRKDAGAPARYWPLSLLAFAFTRNLLALGVAWCRHSLGPAIVSFTRLGLQVLCLRGQEVAAKI